jgi:hypothetical protein
LRCGTDGFVYTAGLAGTLIRGRSGAWESLPQNVTRDDFWGAAVFKNTPYFATERALYRLQDGNLDRVDLRDLEGITTRYLDCNSDVMWSAGSKNLAATRDGRTWQAIAGPS